MDLSQIGLFNGLIGKMDWLTQRQGAIAKNIANSDTPDYQTVDLAPFTFKNMLKKLSPTTTDPAHIQLASGGGSGGNAKEVSSVKSAYELKPDGNAVSNEEEMKKAADTAADYQLAANVYKKSISLIELALGKGS